MPDLILYGVYFVGFLLLFWIIREMIKSAKNIAESPGGWKKRKKYSEELNNHGN